MEPRIQYATTTDGVKIAYWKLGKGLPFVSVPAAPWSHLQLEWQTPEYRPSFERRAERNMLVRYDNRGSGLSDRVTADYSFESHLLDLDAVVARLDLQRFCLFGWAGGTKIAMAYAARRPERVSQLILWGPRARSDETDRRPTPRALHAMKSIDWDLYLETAAHVVMGWTEEIARRWAAFQRRCCEAEPARAISAALDAADVSSWLARIKGPTLVVYRPFPLANLDDSREIASSITNARLVVLKDGIASDPTSSAEDDAYDAFLDEVAEAASCPDNLTPREVQVLQLIAMGNSSNEIARELTLSVRTVGRHITNIYAKIEADSRADATAYALRHDLV